MFTHNGHGNTEYQSYETEAHMGVSHAKPANMKSRGMGEAFPDER